MALRIQFIRPACRQIDAKNQIATVEFDVLGRVVRRQENDSTTIWRFDQAEHGIGKTAEVEKSNGYREVYSYDGLGRSKSVAVQIGKEQFVTSMDYDKLGRPSTLYYPTAFSVRNRYDKKGFLVGPRTRAIMRTSGQPTNSTNTDA